MSRSNRFVEVIRYYQAGVANTIFGFAAYMLLVWAGMNIFLAQAISHFAGMAFNYLTYTKHVFRSADPAKARFIVSYGVNYMMSVLSLAALARFIYNPYISGVLAAVLVSIVNFFILKRIVFRVPTP